jgi:hypothetical protein
MKLSKAFARAALFWQKHESLKEDMPMLRRS